jgi:hypothetical protein
LSFRVSIRICRARSHMLEPPVASDSISTGVAPPRDMVSDEAPVTISPFRHHHRVPHVVGILEHLAAHPGDP